MHINKTQFDCSGCTACACVCPKQCISMEPDSLGFKYPNVDLSRCIDCSLCVKTCPFNSEYNTTLEFDKPITFVGKNKDPEEVMKSQSGGAADILSKHIIKRGGVVYGVGFSKDFQAVHKRASTLQEIEEFRGSKYVQSELNDTFKEIKKDLIEGKEVLFIGTPCQTAGLQSFIPTKLKANLYVIDIICHGVGSPKLWADYLSYLEEKENAKLEKVNFRDKNISSLRWHSCLESFKFVNREKVYHYLYRFYSHLHLRYSCKECPFTNLRRTSDITIGDAWGIEKTAQSYLAADQKGCSLFLINTCKGETLFKAINNSLISQEVDLSQYLQPQLLHPTTFDKKRERFEKDYVQYGFKKVKAKYGPPLSKKIKKFISSLFPKKLKRNMKNILKK